MAQIICQLPNHCICITFADTALIVILGRLPQSEELRVAGGIAQGTFSGGMTLSFNQEMQDHPLELYLGAHAIEILFSKLQILLVDNIFGVYQRCDDDLTAMPSKDGQWTIAQALTLIACIQF